MADRIRVLYADDEPALLEIAKIYLERTGDFLVETYTSAVDVLNSPSILSCSVIISDYQMPEMDGITFLKEVRSRYGDIPFILFTGRGREEVVIDAINNGADFYLQKGGEPKAQFAELAHKIKQAYRRKQAESEVRDSERRLLDIIDFLPDATFATDNNRRIIAWNHSIEEMTGIKASSMLGKGDFSYAVALHKEKRPMLIDLLNEPYEQVLSYYKNVYRNGSTLSGETEIKQHNGEVISVLAKACPLYNQKGEITGAIESIRDITELKKAEAELQKNSERYHDLLNATDLIQSVSPEGEFIFVNKKWLDTLGYKEEEIKSLNLFDILHEDSRKHCQELFPKILSGENAGIIEIAYKTKDGRKIYLQGMATCKISNGQPQYTRGIFKDVTKSKIIEAALIENEEKFRSIFENSPYPIAINSIPDNKFLEVNKSFLDASGYEKDEIIGKDPVKMGLIPLAEAVKLISQRIIKGKLENVPLALKAKDQKPIHVLFSIVPIQIQNRPAIVTMVTEITKLKRVEEELLKANEELGAAYEELAATEEELRHNYDELAQKEEILRQSEEKFRTLVELSLEGILITDFTGKILFANRTAGIIADVSDYSSVIGKRTIMDVVVPESRDDIIKDLKQVSEGTDAYLVQYKLITAAKREVWVECIGKKIPYQNSDAMLVSMRDITGRKIAEEKLKESENKFSTLFARSPVPLTLVSAENGEFVDISDQFLRNTGYTKEELQGKKSSDINLFADFDEYRTFTSHLQKEGFVNCMELKCRIKSGEIRNCRFSSGMIQMNNRPYILSSVQDVTEQKAADEAFRTLFKSMSGATGLDALDTIAQNVSSWLDADCVIIGELMSDGGRVKARSMLAQGEKISDFSYSLKGTPCEDVSKKGFCIYPDNVADLFSESSDIKKFNSRGYIGTPLWNSHGKVIGIFCILSKNPIRKIPGLREIIEIIAVKAASELERSLIEQELKESEEKFSGMVKRSSDLVLIVDRDMKLTYVSPSSTAVSGYEPDELMGKSRDFGSEIVSLDSLQDFMKAVEGSFRGISTDNLEMQITKKDSSKAYISMNVIPVLREGIFKGAQVTIHDITERKAAEEALKKANTKLSLLSGITRHDIKNQIMALNGYVDLLKMQINDSSSDSMFAKIKEISSHITKMINFTKEYEQIGLLKPIWQNAKNLADNAVADAMPGDVKLTNKIPDNLEIFADPMISKIFYNLIDNAVRHETGVSEITFSAVKNNDNIVIACQDNGTGIDDREKERVFEQGYGKNTGFGLHISREILDITGIEIKEKGEYKKGARFELTVPKVHFRFL